MSHRAALASVQSALGLLIGLFIAFAGYRIARRFAALAGFVIGFAVGLVLGIPGGPLVSLVVAVVAGIVFALLFLFAFRFTGGVLGGSIAYSMAASLAWPIWAAILFVLVGIGVGIWLNKLMIVGATSVLGAWLATRSAFELLHDIGATLPWDRTLMGYIVSGVIAILGGLVQWRGLRREA